MDFQEELYEHRYKATLTQARHEYRQKRRGYKVEAKPTGNLAAVGTFVALASSAFLWKKHGSKLRAMNWASMPVIKQVLAFLEIGSPDKGKLAKPSSQAGSTSGKAARQQAREQAREQAKEAEARRAAEEQERQAALQHSNSQKKKKNKKKKK